MIGWIKEKIRLHKENREEMAKLKASFKERVVELHGILTREDCPQETLDQASVCLDSMSVNIQKRGTDRVGK